MERSSYRKQCFEGTHRKLLLALSSTILTLLDWGGTYNGRMRVQCRCGAVEDRRVSDFLSGNPYGCRACTRRRVMQSKALDPGWERHHRRMVDAARAANTVSSEWRRLRQLCQCAKRRCTTPADAAYRNYGGRGITFEFPSASAMAQWVLDTLGPRPMGGSLDRIDNDAGYAAGNLRWATAEGQARNRRRYLGPVYGHRIQDLALLRPDVSYETLRTWVKKGLTDAEIIAKPRAASGRPRIRHKELRSEE